MLLFQTGQPDTSAVTSFLVTLKRLHNVGFIGVLSVSLGALIKVAKGMVALRRAGLLCNVMWAPLDLSTVHKDPIFFT